jgi:hypothetical protein
VAVRLTKKAIVLFSILGLLIFGGITGYLVWTVYYQDNVAPTDSEAGSSPCGSYDDRRECEKNCSPMKGTPPKSYECVWRNEECKDGNGTCDGGGGGGGHVCDNESVNQELGPKKCNLGSPPTCQKSASAPYGNTGYICTCIDLSNADCRTDWRCTTIDLKNCPTDNVAPPNFNCKISGNCISLQDDAVTNWYEHRCPGSGNFSGGCTIQNPIVHSNKKSFCMSRPSGYCGWIQVDSEGYPGRGCFGSWHFPCDDDDDETTPRPPACTSLTMALTPAAQAPTNPIVIPSTGGTITATLTGTDPDSQPGALKICYSIRGKSVEFYKTMTNWVCETKNNAKTMSTSVTHSAMVKSVAAATKLNEAQIEAAGIIFMSEVYDNVDGKICTSNPGYATGATSVIQGTATACGGPCTGSISFTAAPPACGDGILDPGEECDPGATAGTPANSCTVGTCSTECVCPKLDPGFNIQKVPVQQCIEGKDIYADVRYSIVVTNNGTTVGHMSQVTDDLDPKVQDSWIVRTSITPSSGVTVANGQIIWNLDEASRTFDPGESMTFSYVIRIPQANFGNYRNVVTGIVTDEGEANVTDEAIIDVSCLPGTGLFDSTVARIALAGVLLVTGAYFAQSKRLDGVAFTLFTSAGKVETKRAKFEKSI